MTELHIKQAIDSGDRGRSSTQYFSLTPSQITAYFDSVLMLTRSDWKTEPRSNRYHYASRFAKHLPVLFVQLEVDQVAESDALTEEPSQLENLTIWHVSRRFVNKPAAQQARMLLNALVARGLRRPLLWIYHADYEEVVKSLPQFFKVYHATEDYFSTDIFPFDELLRTRLRGLLSHVDLLVTVSPGVLNSYRSIGGYEGRAVMLPNGCDYEFFSRGLSLENVAATSPAGKKIALYQGGINWRLDFELLEAVVTELKDWEFHFCGREDASIRAWQKLKQRPQVTYLGELTPDGVRAVCRTATVGIIPFRHIAGIVESSLPLKAFEYAACGLPVVSIRIRSLEPFPIFCFADTPGQFADALQSAASTRYDPSHLRDRDNYARGMSYDARFDELCGVLSRICDERSREPKNILVLYDDSATHITTVREHLEAFARHSRHHIWYATASKSYVTGIEAPCPYRLEEFDLIVIHYSIRLSLEKHISPYYAEELAACSRPKVLFIQDEYECTATARRWIRQLRIDLVYTCVPMEFIRQVYPPEELPGVRFIQNLTGYVSESLIRSTTAVPIANRQWVIGYRGRPLGYWYGDLAREKLEIGHRMHEICQARHIPANIAWREEDRIYGPDWYQFVVNCRAMLGTESGSNVFDDDGCIRRSIEQALQEKPDLSYEEAHHRFVAKHEGKVVMNQISPKVFEAIAHRTALVLFEGTYSGVVQPHLHFIPLQKDFSNVDEVLAKVQDDEYVGQMTERAYQDVIASGKYSYATFISDFDEVVAECKIVSAPIMFVSSVTATLNRNWINAAKGVVSPRYLPGNHIFSGFLEKEDPPVAVTEGLAAVTESPDSEVLGRIRTKALLGYIARRIWGRVPSPIRSMLRPATTTVRLLTAKVWK